MLVHNPVSRHPKIVKTGFGGEKVAVAARSKVGDGLGQADEAVVLDLGAGEGGEAAGQVFLDDGQEFPIVEGQELIGVVKVHFNDASRCLSLLVMEGVEVKKGPACGWLKAKASVGGARD